MKKHHLDFAENFPLNRYPEILDRQAEALEIVAKTDSVLLELPTGSGKTAIGYTFLKTLAKSGKGPLYYTTPTKTLVDQVKAQHSDVKVIYGRNEYPCLYYAKSGITAEEAPCSMLDCQHRIDAETGKTESGAEPCPYMAAKLALQKSDIVVCTIAFYLYRFLFAEKELPAGLVIDEAHQLAKIFRQCLSYEINYALKRSIAMFETVGLQEVGILKNFAAKMKAIIKKRPPRTATLVDPSDISDLLQDLYQIQPIDLTRAVQKAVRDGVIDPHSERETLKRAETIARNLVKYLKSLEYSLPDKERQPLNYTYAFYEQEASETKRNKPCYRLVIKRYYVAPLIRRVLAPRTLAYSGTIGDSEMFGFETGIKFPFHSFPSEFSEKNTRIFIPNDTPNLAVKSRRRQDKTRSLRKIAKGCKFLADHKLRSLVVVISNEELKKFLMLCKEEEVNVISYGNGIRPREAAEKFKNNIGDVLAGTVANYGEGVDLPKRMAPAIFFLRPSYPNPQDPASIFEERRFGSSRWSLWNWRVMLESLQVRGRNIRSNEDLGVIIFISQQFRRFIPAALPEHLQESFDGKSNLEQCLEKTVALLQIK